MELPSHLPQEGIERGETLKLRIRNLISFVRILFSDVLQLRSRVTAVLGEVKTGQPGLEQQLRKKAWARFGRDHPDRDLLDPLPVPLVILGSKFDVFQNMDPEQRKMVARTLRFIAHTNGASLYVSHLRQKLGVLTRYALIKGTISHTLGMHSDCFMHYIFQTCPPSVCEREVRCSGGQSQAATEPSGLCHSSQVCVSGKFPMHRVFTTLQ